jgi:hypothetical protein
MPPAKLKIGLTQPQQLMKSMKRKFSAASRAQVAFATCIQDFFTKVAFTTCFQVSHYQAFKSQASAAKINQQVHFRF